MRGFVSKLAGLVLSMGLLAFAGEAAAGCNSGCAPPAPPTPPHNPTPPSMPCHSCGGGGGGNTNVNVNVNVKASASGSASAFAGSSSGSTFYGGGYGNWSQTPGYAQPVGGLAVVTGEGEYEAVSESRSMTRTLVIQASCIDDTGVPHPASQLFPDRDVADSYSGELYRCIAGTHMQVVMADCLNGAEGLAGDHAVSESSSYSSEEHEEHGSYGRGGHGYASGSAESHEEHSSSASGSHRVDLACLSHINFDGGKTMTCQKGDALWFDHGNMTCRVQIPARQCNERSLLRRFGVGMKVLTVTRTESFTRKREVASSRSSSSVMVFDGGVGGFVQ